jgi:sulfur carrier protein
MHVYVNDQPTEVAPELTLLDTLRQTGLHEKKGIAVAVNDQVISRRDWAQYHLQDYDKIMIITATQGG